MSEKEYNICVDKHSDAVYGYLLRATQDSFLSKDIIQEAFLRLWQRKQEVEFAKAKSYLFTTAYHLMINDINYNNRKNKIQIQSNQTQETYSNIEEIETQVLKILTQKQRSAILLRDYQGYSYKEIAEILDISQEDVKINIFRARKKLKEYIVRIDNII